MAITFYSEQVDGTEVLITTEHEGLNEIFEVFKNFLKANGYDPDVYDFSNEPLDFDE